MNQQLSGLNKASIKKRQEALIRTEEAIARLTSNKQRITIRSVAKEARVSVSYIYKYPELAYRGGSRDTDTVGEFKNHTKERSLS